MDVSDEERRDAAKAQALVCKKLLEIMELQADIDALLRDEHPTPFGARRWKDARPEELQRLVMMTAVQFILFEPKDCVPGNDDFSNAADELLRVASDQLKWLKVKYHQG